MRWLAMTMIAGLAACTSSPKTGDDTDAPDDSDAADTDVADDTSAAADTDAVDTDTPDTDVADTDSYAGPIGSCDYGLGYCQEYWTDVATMAVYEGACGDGSGAWADAPCSHAGVVGGCRDSSAGWITITNWFTAESGYADAHAVRTACQADGSTYVAP
jgi:hypothetical protein